MILYSVMEIRAKKVSVAKFNYMTKCSIKQMKQLFAFMNRKLGTNSYICHYISFYLENLSLANKTNAFFRKISFVFSTLKFSLQNFTFCLPWFDFFTCTM